MKSGAFRVCIWLCIFHWLFLPVCVQAQSNVDPAGPNKTQGEFTATRPDAEVQPGTGSQADESGPAATSPGESTPAYRGGEIYFAAATVAPNGENLYVVLDRFLLKYKLPELELRRKVEIPMSSAPVSPSISISKDEKHIYVVQNGVIFQIDGETWQIKKTEMIKALGD